MLGIAFMKSIMSKGHCNTLTYYIIVTGCEWHYMQEMLWVRGSSNVTVSIRETLVCDEHSACIRYALSETYRYTLTFPYSLT